MDRDTRRILRYRPPPAVAVVLIIVVWIGLSLIWSGHWQLTIPFVVIAVPWYLVWRHHRVSEVRRLGLLPTKGLSNPEEPD
jgi:hypothetical protein